MTARTAISRVSSARLLSGSALPIRALPRTVLAGICLSAGSVCAQDLDVPYVETPPDVVEIMMDVADVGPDDYVIDLGTGDGRLAIAAVRRGALGLGIDLDPRRVAQARANAQKAGVAQRALFLEQDLFEADIREATVVTLFLNAEVNLKLRSALLENLEPGARVVSHNFDMQDWQPDVHRQYLRESNDSFYMHDVYGWIVPADVRGRWQGTVGTFRFSMTVRQKFQDLQTEIRLDGRSLVINHTSLRGCRLNIIASDATGGAEYVFSGNTTDDEISGVVHTRTHDDGRVATWRARRD